MRFALFCDGQLWWVDRVLRVVQVNVFFSAAPWFLGPWLTTTWVGFPPIRPPGLARPRLIDDTLE